MKIFLKYAFLASLLNIALAESSFYTTVAYDGGLYRYTEPGVMRVYGYSNGLNGGFGYEYNNMLKLDITGSINVYTGKYTGGYLQEDHGNNREKVTSVVFGSFNTIEAKLGYNILSLTHLDSNLYIQLGLGYWFLKDATYPMLRSQRYYYMPIEILGNIKYSNDVSFDYQLGYNHFLKGHHITDATTVNYSGKLDVKQDTGNGFRAMLGISHKYGEFTYLYQLIFEYWRVADSPLSDWITDDLGSIKKYLEPNNHTQKLGFRLGVKF